MGHVTCTMDEEKTWMAHIIGFVQKFFLGGGRKAAMYYFLSLYYVMPSIDQISRVMCPMPTRPHFLANIHESKPE